MTNQGSTNLLKRALAFLMVDVLFWLMIFLSCLIASDMCGVSVIFFEAIYYLPLSLLLPDFGEFLGVSANMFIVSVVGAAFHLLLGIVTGLIFKRFWGWPKSIAFSFLMIVFTIAVSYFLLRLVGRII